MSESPFPFRAPVLSEHERHAAAPDEVQATGHFSAPLLTRPVVTYCPIEDYRDVLRSVRPTALLWPPRFYEKVSQSHHSTTRRRLRAASS